MDREGEVMTFDIVFVTYNSARHIKRCFQAIANSQTSLEELNIIVVDNGSQDDTLKRLEQVQEEHFFPHFHVLKSGVNLGFGKGCNLGAAQGTAPYVFFLNIDTELAVDALEEIRKEIQKSEPSVASFELRQMPYEHPKRYNPVTLEVSWSSGAAVVLRREAFEKVKGFNPHIFMYAEDVDLSWNLRKHGYTLKYVPKATLKHYTYENPGEIKPVQYYNSILNHLLLRIKYGGPIKILGGYLLFLSLFLRKPVFKHSKGILFKKALTRIPIHLLILLQRLFGPINFRFHPKFLGFDYETIREGAFFKSEGVKEGPKVSVLVRTIARPAILEECLISLRNQTYRNFEVIVVEDGPGISEDMIQKKFPDLPIRYLATGEKVGRCKAANFGMEMAEGEYLNFLDDDDLFYGDHLETLVAEHNRFPGKGVYYALSFECMTDYVSRDPLRYKERLFLSFLKQPFNKFKLTSENNMPIQAAMFRKDLYQEIGGFDTSIDTLEDWDFWIRCSFHGDFHYVEKTTSLFRTPYHRKDRKGREKDINQVYSQIIAKYRGVPYTTTFGSMRDDYVDIIESRHRNRFRVFQSRHPMAYRLMLVIIGKIMKRI